MGKKINVMLQDGIAGLFETEFKEEDDQGLFIREYNDGSVNLINHKGHSLARFMENEWVAYAVQKEEDGE